MCPALVMVKLLNNIPIETKKERKFPKIGGLQYRPPYTRILNLVQVPPNFGDPPIRNPTMEDIPKGTHICLGFWPLGLGFRPCIRVMRLYGVNIGIHSITHLGVPLVPLRNEPFSLHFVYIAWAPVL